MLTGSFQRIIMNLVANSLKYTQPGFIKVKLSVRKAHHEEKDQSTDHYDSIVELSVMDSGRGISKDFIRTKLFSAFAQKSTLAPGTGKI
jgi:signal transduction histidine kinase